MKDSTGAFLWSDGLAPGQPSMLCGYRVVECGHMPDIAAGSIPVLFGDLKAGYAIVDRSTRILQDPYSSKPLVLFYLTRRVSGNIVDSNAIKALKVAAS